jgi:protein tyrosine/serine phosphatase
MNRGRLRARVALRGGLLALGLGFLAWAWNSAPLNLEDRLFPKHLVEVEAGWLYRSGQIAPNLIEQTLRDLGIDVVVDLTYDHGDGDEAQQAERIAAKKLGIQIVNFPLGGSGTGLVERYAGAVAAIARAGRERKQVLVHCRAGDRRTGGVIAAYQILVKGVTPAEAREEMERFSRWRSDNTRLVRYFDDHLGEIGERLVRDGTIDHMPEPLPRFALR